MLRQFFRRHEERRPAYIDGKDPASVRRHNRGSDAVDLGPPVAEGGAIAELGDLFDGFGHTFPDFRDLIRLVLLHEVQHVFAFLVRHGRQDRPANGGKGQRQTRADVHGERNRLVGPPDVDIDGTQAMALGQRDRDMRIGPGTQVVHIFGRPGTHFHARQDAVTERQNPGAQLVIAGLFGIHQISELAQRMGQSGHRRLGQTGTFRNVIVGKRRFSRTETAQHLQAASQGRHELAVGLLFFLQNVAHDLILPISDPYSCA